MAACDTRLWGEDESSSRSKGIPEEAGSPVAELQGKGDEGAERDADQCGTRYGHQNLASSG